MKRRAFLLILMLPALAWGQGQTVTGELAPFLEAARLEYQATGALGGEVAARLRGMGMTQPVEVTVQRLHRLREPGCARLRVSFDQRQVMLPNETMPRDRHAEFTINWCEGGRPPASVEGARPANQKDRP